METILVDSIYPPYCRLMASWRTRKCVFEHHYLVKQESIDQLITIIDFNEKSHSIAHELKDGTDTDQEKMIDGSEV
eukprot:gene4885-6842_t